MISRRFFIGGAFGFAALGPRLAFAAKPGAFADGKPALTFGVLSDVHIGLASGGRKLLPSYDTRYLEKAFGYFRDQGADGNALSVRVLTPAFRYAPTAKRVHRPTVCRIALDRLAPGDLEFKVRAVTAWGRTSDPLVGTFRLPSAA